MFIFLSTAFVACWGIAIVSGVLGAFVQWRRLAYFGETLSHSALLGVTLGLYAGLHPSWTTALTIMVVASFLVWLKHKTRLAYDAVLGMTAHATLALGMLAIHSVQSIRVDVLSFFYGDLLTLSWDDVLWIYFSGACILAVLARFWRAQVALAVHPDLLRVEGGSVLWQEWIFVILLSWHIAMMMQVVGVLLATSVLLIAASTARSWARSPEHMVVLSCLINGIGMSLGLLFSYLSDSPTGPAIVLTLFALFMLSLFGQWAWKTRKTC